MPMESEKESNEKLFSVQENCLKKVWCLTKLEKILQTREKWIKVDDCDILPGCPQGENFVADVVRVVVYGKRLNLGMWTDFRKSLIVKKIPECDSFSHNFHDCFGLFENEITAYENILPQYQNYLEEKSHDDINELCFPKYYGQGQTLLVLQDLQTEGYQMVNRVKGFSRKECSLILRELSKFHGISLSLRKRDNEDFAKLTCTLKETVFQEKYIKKIMGVIWENSVKLAIRSLNETNDTRLKKVSEKLYSYSGKVLATLIKLSKSNLGKFDVVCHGDLWSNNILLRYCDSGYPIGVKFIDLQAMRYGSCVLDVMHVLFTSSRPDIFKKYFKVLIAEYYDCLASNLADLKETLDFTFEDFKAEFKEKIFFGIFVACLMFTFITKASIDEKPNSDFSMENLEMETEIERQYKTLNSEYHERLRALFLTLTDFNLI